LAIVSNIAALSQKSSRNWSRALWLYFAWNVLWPEGTASAPLSGRFEWFSLLIGVGAFGALWRYKVGIISR
jgi:hypothetical protein